MKDTNISCTSSPQHASPREVATQDTATRDTATPQDELPVRLVQLSEVAAASHETRLRTRRITHPSVSATSKIAWR